jgi:hypothetical protein
MRLTGRAAFAALTTLTAAAVTLLPLAGPAAAATSPPAPNTGLYGTWANTNPATRNVADIVVTPSGGGITVDGYGACSPSPCQWGNVPATVFGNTVTSSTGKSFEASWNFGFADAVLLATLSHPHHTATLTVKELTAFTDGSGRANYSQTETFTQASPITPTATGTPASGYPTGDSVAPVNSLNGTWVNTSPTGGDITQVVFGRTASGALTVHAYGNCSPTLCDWGQVNGITYGKTVESSHGRVFLAPYTFSFKTALLSGWLNNAGTRLTIQAYSQFTDGSGRSSYLTTDTFTRA